MRFSRWVCAACHAHPGRRGPGQACVFDRRRDAKALARKHRALQPIAAALAVLPVRACVCTPGWQQHRGLLGVTAPCAAAAPSDARRRRRRPAGRRPHLCSNRARRLCHRWRFARSRRPAGPAAPAAGLLPPSSSVGPWRSLVSRGELRGDPRAALARLGAERAKPERDWATACGCLALLPALRRQLDAALQMGRPGAANAVEKGVARGAAGKGSGLGCPVSGKRRPE